MYSVTLRSLTKHWANSIVVKIIFQKKSLRVLACVHVCVLIRVLACTWVCGACMRACMGGRACVLNYKCTTERVF